MRYLRRSGLIPAHAGKTGRNTTTRRSSGAHPRSRGENAPTTAPGGRGDGSSPLTRGKRSSSLSSARSRRLIPAHAGKTPLTLTPPTWTTAHPRSRGENWRVPLIQVATLGSSPLTRGKPRLPDNVQHSPGLIPAHAGKTQTRAAARLTRRAHPRSRGENCTRTGKASQMEGSSPLTRGKLKYVRNNERCQGLIPAHAGKTLGRCPGGTGGGAHPRSRGENTPPGPTAEGEVGSSPLTRGKLHVRLLVGPGRGLIPAHAGKTRLTVGNHVRLPAHPRSRGENSPPARVRPWATGSSPLTRGKRYERGLRGGLVGLIPAHAGKTSSAQRATAARRAHPRSRGENVTYITDPNTDRGSSPLTRGKLGNRALALIVRGLIPAHAGKTPPSG